MFRKTILFAILIPVVLWSSDSGTSRIPVTSPLRGQPRVASVPSAELAQARLLGTPTVRTLLGYTRRVLHLQDGHTLAAFSYASAAPANWLLLIDSRDLSFQRYDIPNNDVGSHGGTMGADGNVYVMPFGNARAYRFVVESRKFESLETGLPKGELTWEAFGASNGRIYFGTYPNAYLGEYIPSTGKCNLWKQVAPNTKYVTDFSEDSQGLIHFRAWGPDQVWTAFDPKTSDLDRSNSAQPHAEAPPAAVPETPKGDARLDAQASIGGRRFVISFPSSRLWEIGPDGKLSLLGDPNCPGEAWFVEAVPGAVVGISHFGMLFRYDLKTGQFVSRQLPTSVPAGNAIMFVEAVTPRSVIGANYTQQNLFKVDPTDGDIEASPTTIARVPGEAFCAVGFHGKAYIGIYTHSILSKYDPEMPFRFGENPRELAELGTRYRQTRPRDAITNGKLVFISSDSDYNYLGGALAVINPDTDQVDVYNQLITDQNLPTLAYDAATRLLWGGTDRWGQARSHPPTQESSLIYAFDPEARKVVDKLTLWPGSDETSVLGVSANGILVATSGREMALIDTTTRKVLYHGPSPIDGPGKLRLGKDGFSYCLSAGTLYRWDLVENVLTPVAASPGCTFLTESSPGIWVVANSSSVYRIDLVSIPKSAKTHRAVPGATH